MRKMAHFTGNAAGSDDLNVVLRRAILGDLQKFRQLTYISTNCQNNFFLFLLQNEVFLESLGPPQSST